MRPTIKLWEICEIERWGSPRPIQEFLTTDENWVNWIKIWDTKTQPKYIKYTAEKIKPEWVKRSRMVYPWDFILSNSMSFGRPYIMKTSWCIHDWRLVLRPDNRIDKEFLYYLLGSEFMYKKFENSASWTWVKNLNIDKVKVVEIPLPPLETQKAIVAKLDQIFAELDQTKSEIQKNLDNTDEFLNSAWSKAFQEIWNIKILWEVCTMTQWIQIPLSDTITKFEPWYKRYIYISDLIDDDHIKYVRDIYPDKEVSENDLIMVNTWSTSWKIYWGKKWILSNNVFKIVGNENIIIQKYLYHYLKSYYFQSNLERQLKHWAQPHLWHKIMSKQIIPVPPLSEQEKIVEHLDQVSKEVKALKSQYQSQLDNLEELKKSVLDKAFRWEMGE